MWTEEFGEQEKEVGSMFSPSIRTRRSYSLGEALAEASRNTVLSEAYRRMSETHPREISQQALRDQSESYHLARRPFPTRITGPVRFVGNLLRTWRLERRASAALLGFEQIDLPYVYDVLDGRRALPAGRDIKDRIAYLFQIRRTLFGLFRDEEVENDWLREEHSLLEDQSPLALMLEGSMENLLLVKEYVETAAGR